MMRSWFSAACALLFLGGCALFPPAIPPYEAPKRTVWLNQNWSNEARFWFHHATQGTSTLPVPYDWFVALEQPQLFAIGAAPLLSDKDYLARFGFISSPRGPYFQESADASANGYDSAREGRFTVRYDPEAFNGNPDGLPVGFARTKGYKDPVTGNMLPDQIGLTCAACHTGQLTYKGVNVRVDGGPAVTNLGDFRKALGLSLAYTALLPGRFERFADRVLPKGHGKPERAELKKQFLATIEKVEALSKQMAPGLRGSIEEGFARLDALNRIGNQVFFNDLVGTKQAGFDPAVNVAPTKAPVNYPQIWSTSWFDWVQYDASIMQPMIRNAGEALGVSANLNLTSQKDLYWSSVAVEEVFRMEELLAGPDPRPKKQFQGLRAPQWPGDILGPIDPLKARKGAALYVEHCSGCHRPAPDSDAFWSDTYWKPIPDAKGRYLDVAAINLAKVGTDPAQANVLHGRKVKVPTLLGVPKAISSGGMTCGGEPGTVVEEASFAWALAYVVDRTVDYWYDAQKPPVPPRKRMEMNGDRPNCVRAPLAYKARPLNGVWATAPFLHNGTVLTLYDLLSPQGERPRNVCLGDREFDPVKVGMRGRCGWGVTKIDTRAAGNLNSGHSFENESGPGVIGPAFSATEKAALIEYLKTL
ncbi:di-heme-cytochrome C peroxidase [Nisaea sp.]|uniref:di-heme-cytochrome C peroxidase n=1 Tax=Nisaea sp. TaxID=2024842 RepID=UPI003296CA86